MSKEAKRRAFRRRIISVFLSTVMCMTCVPLSFAGEQNDSADNAYAVLEEMAESGETSEADYSGYIIKLKDEASLFSVRSDEEKPVALAEIKESLADQDSVDEISEADGLYAVSSLEDIASVVDPAVIQYIEPDYTVRMYDDEMKAVRTDVSPEDNEKHLELMNVPEVRDGYGIRGEDFDTETDMGNDGDPADHIVIAVIDSGLDTDHEDIDYTHVLPGESFVSTATTSDTLGHGTFVTGEIIAGSDNGTGIDGIAEDLYVMPLKVFSSRTTANSTIIKAFNYAVEQTTALD